MIFVTGDTHGDFRRFGKKSFPEQSNLCSDDYVIVCGDFGLLGLTRTKEEEYWRKWLEERPFTICFVCGNHENYDRLFSDEFPVDEWAGGRVRFLGRNIIYLGRGQVFDISGNRIFTFGGAASHDLEGEVLSRSDPNYAIKKKRLLKANKFFRTEHEDWWKEELPTQEEMEDGMLNLKKVGNKVDYIITHCAASDTQKNFEGYPETPLNVYFESLEKTVDYRHWYFGHYHENRGLNDKETILYEKIVPIL